MSVPDGYVPAFGVPYARQNEDGTVTCPNCGRHIRQTERKDFESFTGHEYADHYDAEHAADDGRVPFEGQWYEKSGRERSLDDLLSFRIRGEPVYREAFMPDGERVAINIEIERIAKGVDK